MFYFIYAIKRYIWHVMNTQNKPLKITGKVLMIFDATHGEKWSKRDFLIETLETNPAYQNKIYFTAFGDKAAILERIRLDDIIDVFFNINSREYNGKYYTDCNAWNIVIVSPFKAANYENN